MRHHGLASARVYQTGGPTAQNSIPLVMVPTPVPPTRRRGITVSPARCPVLPLVPWAGPDPAPQMAPHLPLCRPPPRNRYSSGSLSLQTQAKALPPTPRLPCPNKQSEQTPLRRWPYVPMSQTTHPGPSPPERVPPP